MAEQEIVAPVDGEATSAPVEVVPPVDAAPAPQPEPEAAPAPETPGIVEEVVSGIEHAVDDVVDAIEHAFEGLIGGDTVVPMAHPKGGTSDAYETDASGNLLVPASQVPLMQGHGFEPVAA